MTDIRATRKSVHWLVGAALAGLLLGGLSACSSGAIDDPKLRLTEGAAATPFPALVAFKPLGGGAPEAVSQRLMLQLNSAATKRNIAILVDPGAKAPRSLQGNIWLRPDVSGTKLVHVWDVMGETGERLSRSRGEEPLAQASASGDPWSAVTQAQIDAVADKALAALAGPPTK